ncbi:MAG: ribosome-associated translation inhibitor RaiA [Bacteroidales bacterium]|nr:ribosome-associated translation inhibitor RaiA [Bacteroidales bacterium]MDD4821388.1 ribosome-associated translation inhibitor RaiA [Bacteroidales bacterium]
MEIKIKAIHFDASQQLESFIMKKVSKLEQYYDGILTAEVALKVVKPETVENKEAQIKLLIASNEIFASKISNTFEESIDESVEALTKQLLKYKEKMRQK